MKKIITFILILAIIVFAYQTFQKSTGQTLPYYGPKVESSVSNSPKNESSKIPAIVADKLQIPWSLVFLPDKSILFTERPGRVRQISNTGQLQTAPVATIKEVKPLGEGGLLGIEIHPNFSKNHFVYLYYTYYGDEKRTLNKVTRFTYDGKQLSNSQDIVSAIPGNSNHNGGRLKFGPDGFLYITTGDSQEPSLAQDKSSLAGKILRVTDEGLDAPGNPFNNLIYTYGHRNPQGIAWDEQGRLWSTEHGPSTKDEINRLIPGNNYGWPDITGSETKNGLVTSEFNSGSSTWAPSGAAYIKPFLYFAGLRGNALFRYNTQTKELKQYLKGEYGRLRDVVFGPDGFLYLTTSNLDGRSLTHLDGDKIIRLDPDQL